MGREKRVSTTGLVEWAQLRVTSSVHNAPPRDSMDLKKVLGMVVKGDEAASAVRLNLECVLLPWLNCLKTKFTCLTKFKNF